MNYYVVSPNVYNDGYNYAQKMFSKKIAAVGWDTDRPKGQQFDSIMQGDCIIVAQRINWQWTYYYMGIVSENEDEPSFGTLSKRLSPIISLDGIDLDFDNWTANGSNQVPSPQRIDINSNIDIIENINKILNMQKYIDLLKSNHNLILTGAPGTGKTYLAKEIAESMGCSENEIGFVQFHPSYDYTDFVEGLRPLNDDNGNVGFELKKGVFKDFCAKALKNYLDSSKQETEIEDDKMFEKVYSSLLNDIEDETISKYPTQKGDCDVYLSKTNQIVFNTKSELGRKKYVKEDYLKALFNDVKDENIDLLNISREQLDERVAKTTDIKHVDYIQYRWTLHCLVEKYKKLKNDASENKIQKIELRPFVFIIDEINRGEINKIFGELFFSIDPGYRGERVQTQYQNMVEEGDLFKKGFFVPQNVYIIGTMNDIDRSVESMDFAFRRRFAFKEVTAKESQGILDSVEAWGKDENGNSLKPADDIVADIKEKMDNLNKAIWHKPIDGESDEDKSIEGLSSAYHIGASYFLKLNNYKNDDGSFDFDKLWEYHLEGLLFEYLRGMTELSKKLKKLAEAYGYTKASNYE